MRALTFDPTAGGSAPGIVDPTDPRYGELAGAFHVTNPRRAPSGHGHGPNVGHVKGHNLYEPAQDSTRRKPPGHVKPNG